MDPGLENYPSDPQPRGFRYSTLSYVIACYSTVYDRILSFSVSMSHVVICNRILHLQCSSPSIRSSEGSSTRAAEGSWSPGSKPLRPESMRFRGLGFRIGLRV